MGRKQIEVVHRVQHSCDYCGLVSTINVSDADWDREQYVGPDHIPAGWIMRAFVGKTYYFDRPECVSEYIKKVVRETYGVNVANV